MPDSRWNCGQESHLEERQSREQLCSFMSRIEHAATLSIEDLHEAIKLYRNLLLANPPQELLPSLYCGLGNASYRDGNLVDALVYWELYREFCPEQEESALEAMIAILRKPIP